MEGQFRWLQFEWRDGWPGLARLWRAGLSGGLLLAVVFSVLLNATLISTWIYPAMMPWSIKVGLWVSTFAAWMAGWVDARRFQRAEQISARQDPQLDLETEVHKKEKKVYDAAYHMWAVSPVGTRARTCGLVAEDESEVTSRGTRRRDKASGGSQTASSSGEIKERSEV